MSAVSKPSPAPSQTSTASVLPKTAKPGTRIESKPIQWATSTGSTVLQHLAAQREQNKLKGKAKSTSSSTPASATAGTSLARDDLINSKHTPSGSASSPTINKAKTTPGKTNGTSIKGNGTPTKPTGSNGVGSAAPSSFSLPSTSTGAQTAKGGAGKALPNNAPSPDRGSSEGPDVSSAKAKAPRRRKANRACSHCQKAHLTCDDSRPCERCVKKGLADSCTDGARKKAKYLLDEDELQALKQEKDSKTTNTADAARGVRFSSTASDVGDHTMSNGAGPMSVSNVMMAPDQSINDGSGIMVDPMAAFNALSAQAPLNVNNTVMANLAQQGGADMYGNPLNSFSPASGSSNSGGMMNAFGSEHASLEYSILSSMLHGIDPSWLSGSPDQQVGGTGGLTTDADEVLQNGGGGNYLHVGIDSMPWVFTDPSSSNSPWREPVRTPGPMASTAAISQPVEPLHHLNANLALSGPTGAKSAVDGVTEYDALEVPSPQEGHGDQNGRTDAVGRAVLGVHRHADNLTNASERDIQASKAAAAAAAAGLDHKPDAVWKERVKHIYGDTTRPFPYTEGYHFLIKYVTANLDKADVLRIVRALAMYRPSLIALQMPLTEDDEVFVERSIQRTILEFEKLISFSGTPTVVWRRTCEVVVVGAEFSMLTQWSKEYLMGRYIYEFFDKLSILEYWEKFALHAFENTAQSIMMPVTLKTSTGGTTRCAACFSIKRDIFDLPSLIVGNFLPILG